MASTGVASGYERRRKSGLVFAVAPRFVSASSNTSGTSSVVVTAPANIVAGNLLVAAVGCIGGDVTTPPSGWTLLGSSGHSTGGSLAWLTKTATNSEPASYTFTGTNVFMAAAVLQYTTFTTNDGTPTFATGGGVSGTTATAPSITAVGTGDLWLVGIEDEGTGAITGPAGFTQRANVVTQANNAGIAVFDKQLAASGATGTAAATLTPADFWTAGSLLLK